MNPEIQKLKGFIRLLLEVLAAAYQEIADLKNQKQIERNTSNND